MKLYKGKILPYDHPVTQNVFRVVSRVLVANGLGTLSYPGMPIESFGDEVDEYQVMHGDTRQKKWNLLVVNDPSTVNAMATTGLSSSSSDFALS